MYVKFFAINLFKHCSDMVLVIIRSQATISYGNASELYFSQHGILRDLAMYLGSRDSLVHDKKLLMPRKEQSLPGKWEMLNDRQFNVQIVSVYTGRISPQKYSDICRAKLYRLFKLLNFSSFVVWPSCIVIELEEQNL